MNNWKEIKHWLLVKVCLRHRELRNWTLKLSPDQLYVLIYTIKRLEILSHRYMHIDAEHPMYESVSALRTVKAAIEYMTKYDRPSPKVLRSDIVKRTINLMQRQRDTRSRDIENLSYALGLCYSIYKSDIQAFGEVALEYGRYKHTTMFTMSPKVLRRFPTEAIYEIVRFISNLHYLELQNKVDFKISANLRHAIQKTVEYTNPTLRDNEPFVVVTNFIHTQTNVNSIETDDILDIVMYLGTFHPNKSVREKWMNRGYGTWN